MPSIDYNDRNVLENYFNRHDEEPIEFIYIDENRGWKILQTNKQYLLIDNTDDIYDSFTYPIEEVLNQKDPISYVFHRLHKEEQERRYSKYNIK